MTFDADPIPPDHDDIENYDSVEFGHDETHDDAPVYDDAPQYRAPEIGPMTSPPQEPSKKVPDSGRVVPHVPILPQFGQDGLPQRLWFLDMLGIEDPIVLGLLVLAAPLVILALLLPPFTVLDVLDDQVSGSGGSGGDHVQSALPVPDPEMWFQPFNAEESRVTIGALTIAAPPGAVPDDFQVYGVGMAPEHYTGGWLPDAGWHCATTIPQHHQLVSDVYSLGQRGTPPANLTLTLNATPGLFDDPATLELRTWDETAAIWEPILTTPDETGTFTVTLEALPRCLAIFRLTDDYAPTVNVTVRPGDIYAPDLLPANTRVFAGTLHPAHGGTVQVDRGPAFDLRPGSSIIVLAQNFTNPAAVDSATVRAILADPAQRTAHAHALAAFAIANVDYTGLALDYRGLDPALRDSYTQFVTELARLLHWNRRTLTVILPPPSQLDDQVSWGAEAYDWHALGRVADEVVVTLPPSGKPFWGAADPTPAEALIAWAQTVIDPLKLVFSLDALSVETQTNVDGGTAPITFLHAIEGLGKIVLQPEAPLEPLQAVTARLSPLGGITATYGRDADAHVPYVTYYANGVPLRTIWLTDIDTLAFRVLYLQQLGAGGVMITNLMAPGTVPGVENTLLRAIQGAAITSPPLEFEVEWTVRQGDQLIGLQTLLLEDMFAFVTTPRGNTLAVEARLNGMLLSSKSASVVGANAAAPAAATTLLPDFGAGVHVATAESVTPALAGLAEEWVATDIVFQTGTDPRPYEAQIQALHDLGLNTKVYVRLRVDMGAFALAEKDIFQREYGLFAASLAGYGADALEIHPGEANVWSVWDHVVHLSTTYSFIKSTRPNTLVIAALQIDDGLDLNYFTEMGDYNLPRFMDCVGIQVRADGTFASPEEILGQKVAEIHEILKQPYPVCITAGYWTAPDTVNAQRDWLAGAVTWSRAQEWVPLLMLWTADASLFEPDDPDTGFALVQPDGICPACEAIRAVLDAGE